MPLIGADGGPLHSASLEDPQSLKNKSALLIGVPGVAVGLAVFARLPTRHAQLRAPQTTLLDSLQLPKPVRADFESGLAPLVAAEETLDLAREPFANQAGVLHMRIL